MLTLSHHSIYLILLLIILWCTGSESQKRRVTTTRCMVDGKIVGCKDDESCVTMQITSDKGTQPSANNTINKKDTKSQTHLISKCIQTSKVCNSTIRLIQAAGTRRQTVYCWRKANKTEIETEGPPGAYCCCSGDCTEQLSSVFAPDASLRVLMPRMGISVDSIHLDFSPLSTKKPSNQSDLSTETVVPTNIPEVSAEANNNNQDMIPVPHEALYIIILVLVITCGGLVVALILISIKYRKNRKSLPSATKHGETGSQKLKTFSHIQERAKTSTQEQEQKSDETHQFQPPIIIESLSKSSKEYNKKETDTNRPETETTKTDTNSRGHKTDPSSTRSLFSTTDRPAAGLVKN